MSEEEWWQLRLQRLAPVQGRVREIMDRAKILRLRITGPLRERGRERVGEFLDRVAPLPAQQQQEKRKTTVVKCSGCGAEVFADYKFCPSCGVSLTQEPKSFSRHFSVEV